MIGVNQGIKILSGFQTTVENLMPKLLLRPITTGTNSVMNQSEFLAITCNLLNAREESRVQGAIGFGFASHWLKNWREVFKPITKRSNRNRVITFDSHLKTAQSSGKISPRLHSIRCMLILISVTKCPLNTSPSLLARNTDNKGHKVSPWLVSSKRQH